jgi:hypothetical protein
VKVQVFGSPREHADRVLERFDLVAALLAAHTCAVTVPLCTVVDAEESAGAAFIIILKLLFWSKNKVSNDRGQPHGVCWTGCWAVRSCGASKRRRRAVSTFFSAGARTGAAATGAASTSAASTSAASTSAASPAAKPGPGAPRGPSESGSAAAAAKAPAEPFCERRRRF